MKLARNTYQHPLKDKIDLSHFVASDIAFCSHGAMVASLALEGLHFFCLDSGNINQASVQLKEAVKDVDVSCALWATATRRRHVVKEQGASPAFTKEYYHELSQRPIFENKFYLNIVQKMPAILKPGNLIFNKKALRGQSRAQKEAQDKLNETTNQLVSQLQAFSPKRLGESLVGKDQISEQLSLFGQLLNLEDKDYLYPMCSLYEAISEKSLYVGSNTIQINNDTNCSIFAGILSIKQYAPLTMAGMLEPLLSLPQEMNVTQVFVPLEKQKALDLVRRHQRQLMGANDAAVSQVDEIDSALDDIQSGRVSFGLHTGFVLCYASTQEGLNENILAAKRALESVHLKAIRETLNLESSFWAQFPGNLKDLRRQALISSNNFADIILPVKQKAGHAGLNHLGKEVCLLETPAKELFHFNFHKQGAKSSPALGHTTLIGASGAGKTTLMCALDTLMRERFKARTFICDYRKGMGVYVLSTGGAYHEFEVGRNTGINPIPLDDTPKARHFLKQWLAAIILRGSEALDAEDEAHIGNAIDGIYNLPKDERNLRNLLSFFNHHWPKYSRLNTWLHEAQGTRAYLFDNDTDFSLESDVIGFDLTQLMDDEVSLLPVMLYLLYRIEASLDGRLTCILLDEGWQFLSHSYWQHILQGWLATLRKENAFVVFATQNPREVAQNPLSFGLIQGAATNLFLSNSQAQKEDYIDGFSLNQREFEIIKGLKANERYFLIKQENQTHVARLNLSGLDKYIALFSTNQHDFDLAKKLKAKEYDWFEKYRRSKCTDG